MTVLREAYIKVEPNTDGFDVSLKEQLRRKDPGGKAGKLVGSQLNAALRRVDIDTIDIKANPREALVAIAATEERLKALARDSATVEVKVRTERALGELRRFKKQLGDVGGEAGPPAALSFAERFSAKLGPLLDGAPVGAPLGAAMAGAAVLVVPFIGATVAGAVIGGVGIGGVIGGLALAAKDPRVKAAGTALSANLLGSLQKDAAVFVGPALQAVDLIGVRFGEVDGHIQSIFRNSARFVLPLTDGVTRALQAITGGVDALISKAGPVIDVISRGIAQLGDAVGDVFRKLSKDGPAAATALQLAFNLVSTTIRAIGTAVDLLSKAFGFLAKLGAFGKAAQVQMIGLETNAKLAAAGVDVFAGRLSVAAVTADDLAQAQARVTTAQDGLQHSLDSLGGATSRQSMLSAALKTAMDNQYGAAIRNTEANESYQTSFDGLSATVKANAGQFAHHSNNLSINTVAGRSNRDALEGLLTSTNEMYLAEIAAGVSVAQATKKHEARIAAVKEEAKRVGLNKAATDALIATYGQVPKKKQTDLVLAGVNAIVQALQGLYLYQRALATGRPVGQVAHEIAKEKGLPKGFQGPIKGPDGKYYAEGGWTGPGSKYQLAGAVHANEWVHPNETVDYYGPSIMSAIQKRAIPAGELAALASYARGGRVAPIAPVDTSRRWPFTADMSGSFVPSKSQVASKVTPAFSGGGPTLDFIIRAVHARFPGLRLISGYRPGAKTLSGNDSYHAFHRAADWPASRPLAEFWNQNYMARTKEFISPWNDLNIHNGKRHSYTGAIYRQHSGANAHDHIAMGFGGVIAEPVRGVGASGRSYSFGERGPETVTPGVGGGGGNTYILNFSGPVASKQAAKVMVLGAIKELKSERKLP